MAYMLERRLLCASHIYNLRLTYVKFDTNERLVYVLERLMTCLRFEGENIICVDFNIFSSSINFFNKRYDNLKLTQTISGVNDMKFKLIDSKHRFCTP